MDRNITIVGMDAHKAFIQVAVLAPDSKKPEEWRIENTRSAIGRLAKLASRYRAGLLTEVHPPTVEQEAVRDLCRARDDARDARQRARHQLGKFLLRRGLSFSGRAWTRRHQEWMASLSFKEEAAQLTFDHYFRAVDVVDEQVRSLDALIEEASRTEAYKDAVGVLRCFHGVDALTAMIFLTELGDITRFSSARQLMSYIGVTPSEYSSGGRERRGAITKAGNAHARRVLVETGWHYRHCARISRKLKERRQDQPQWAQAIADRAHKRLARRYRHLQAQEKPNPKVNIAIVRELSGFL